MSEFDEEFRDDLDNELELSGNRLPFYLTVIAGLTMDDLVAASGLSIADIVRMNPQLADRAEKGYPLRAGETLRFPFPVIALPQHLLKAPETQQETKPETKTESKPKETAFDHVDKLTTLDTNKQWLDERSYKQLELNATLRKREHGQKKETRDQYSRMENSRKLLENKTNEEGIVFPKKKLEQITAKYEKKLARISKKEGDHSKRKKNLESNFRKRMDKWADKLVIAQTYYHALHHAISTHKRELLKEYELMIIEDQLTVFNEGEQIDIEYHSVDAMIDSYINTAKRNATATEKEKDNFKKEDEKKSKEKADKKKADKKSAQIKRYKELLGSDNESTDGIDVCVKELEDHMKILEISGRGEAQKLIEKMMDPAEFHPDLTVKQYKQVLKLFTSSELNGQESRMLLNFIEKYLPGEHLQRAVFGYDEDQVDPAKLDDNLRKKVGAADLSKEEKKKFTAEFDWGRGRKKYIEQRTYYNTEISPLLRTIKAEHLKRLGINEEIPFNYKGTGTQNTYSTKVLEDFTHLPMKEKLSYYISARSIADKIDMSKGIDHAKRQLFLSCYQNDFALLAYFPELKSKLADPDTELKDSDFHGIDVFPLVPDVFKDKATGWLKDKDAIRTEDAVHEGFMPPMAYTSTKPAFNPLELPKEYSISEAQHNAFRELSQPFPGYYMAAKERIWSAGVGELQLKDVNQAKLDYLKKYPQTAQSVLTAGLYQQYATGTLDAASLAGVDVFPEVDAKYKTNGWLMTEEAYQKPFQKTFFDPFQKQTLKFVQDNFMQNSGIGNTLMGSLEYFQRSPLGFANEFPGLTSTLFPLGVAALTKVAVDVTHNVKEKNYFGDATSILNLTKPSIPVKLFETTPHSYGEQTMGPWKGDMKFKLGRTSGIIGDGQMGGIKYAGGDFLSDRNKYSAKTGLDFNADFSKKNTRTNGTTDFETTFGPRASVMGYFPNPNNANGVLQLAENPDTKYLLDFLKTGDTELLSEKFGKTNSYKLDYKTGFEFGLAARGLKIDSNFYYTVLNNFDPVNPIYKQSDVGVSGSYNFPNLFGPTGGFKVSGSFSNSWRDIGNTYKSETNITDYKFSAALNLAEKYYKQENRWKLTAGTSFASTATQTYDAATGTMGETKLSQQLSADFNFERNNKIMDSNWKQFMMGLNFGYNFQQKAPTLNLTWRARF